MMRRLFSIAVFATLLWLLAGPAMVVVSAQQPADDDAVASLREVLESKIRPANDGWLGKLVREGDRAVVVSLKKWTPTKDGIDANDLARREKVLLKLATPFEVRAGYYLYELTPEELVSKGIYRGTVPYDNVSGEREVYLFQDTEARLPRWLNIEDFSRRRESYLGELSRRPNREVAYSLFVDTQTGRIVEERYSSSKLELALYYMFVRAADSEHANLLETLYPATVMLYTATKRRIPVGGLSVEPYILQRILRFSIHEGYWLCDQDIRLSKGGHSIVAVPRLLSGRKYAACIVADYSQIPSR